MELIFVNRYYWPDETATAQLLADLAEALAAAGHGVTVIAGRPEGAPRAETRRGVRIERVRGTRSGAGRLGAKALDYATFAFAALARLARLARRGAIAIALTDPPLIGIGVWLVARARGARCCHWIQDIYPEIALALTGRRELAWLRPARSGVWRRSDACVTLGADMAGVVAGAGVGVGKIHIIPNWPPAGLAAPSEADVAALRRDWGLTGKFVVLYSGNLGRVHDLEPVLAVAACLKRDPGIALVFVGGGAQRAALEAAAARLGLTSVQFRPAQPRSALAATLALGDAHWVTLRPGCEAYVFPSKLYGAAAAGRPVIFVGPPASEPARLIAAGGFGRVFDRDGSEALAESLRELSRSPALCAELGARARNFAAHAGSAASAAQRWQGVLSDVQMAG